MVSEAMRDVRIFNKGAQVQFGNITNIRLGHDKLKTCLRLITTPCPAPDLDTRKIGDALVGQEIDVIKLVPVLLDAPSQVLTQLMCRSPKGCPDSLQLGANSHDASVAQRDQPCLTICLFGVFLQQRLIRPKTCRRYKPPSISTAETFHELTPKGTDGCSYRETVS
ncbi:hypothetical protein XH98_17195 [Bradyrhizobium sp. CCBAU 51745]|nr:hypothetical protein [Bradyrhizobium sp. CCBAU 51745]